MSTGRLEAFSDGVIAVIITIMVLELKAPEEPEWAALRPLLPHLFVYVLSFIFVGIYWNNHHHLMHATDRISGGVLWANLHLLFWLSLVPLVTGWVGEHHDAAVPSAVYGFVLLMCGVAYTVLLQMILAVPGANQRLASAVGDDWKGKLSMLLYAAGIGVGFIQPWLADAVYVTVAVIWFVPDRRIEHTLER